MIRILVLTMLVVLLTPALSTTTDSYTVTGYSAMPPTDPATEESELLTAGMEDAERWEEPETERMNDASDQSASDTPMNIAGRFSHLVWQSSLVSPSFIGDKGTRLHGTAKWEGNPPVVWLGSRGWAQIPSHSFVHSSSFTISVWIQSAAFINRQQFIYANWKRPWSFYIALKPTRGKKYTVEAVLRRKGRFSSGSHRQQDLASVHGGIVHPKEWCHLAVTWDGRDGVIRIFLNDVMVATGRRKAHAGSEQRIRVNPFGYDQIGYKEDSKSAFFYGKVSELVTGNIAVW